MLRFQEGSEIRQGFAGHFLGVFIESRAPEFHPQEWRAGTALSGGGVLCHTDEKNPLDLPVAGREGACHA